MRKAGGRLFVDVTHHLASPDSREVFLKGMGQHDQALKRRTYDHNKATRFHKVDTK